MSDDDLVGTAEARKLAGRATFGDDWIEAMSPSDDKLIEEYGPTIAGKDDAFYVEEIRRCPPTVRDKLDRAMGRFFRMKAQRTAVEHWLMRSGPTSTFGARSRAALEVAFAKLEQAPPSKPARGRPSKETDLVETKVRSQLRAGALTNDAIAAMYAKDIARQFECSTKVATAVKRRIADRPFDPN